jgi:hypothetical protein
LEHAAPKVSSGVVTPSESESESASDDGAEDSVGAASALLGSELESESWLLEQAAMDTAASAAATSEATRWVFFTGDPP